MAQMGAALKSANNATMKLGKHRMVRHFSVGIKSCYDATIKTLTVLTATSKVPYDAVLELHRLSSTQVGSYA